MAFFRNQHKDQARKIELLRQSFLMLTADGTYPHHRQHRLFLACQRAGLDWDFAREQLKPEAAALLRNVARDVIADRKITQHEVQELQSLQRRLGLGDDDVPFMNQLYELVESKLQARIIEKAAYLGNERVATSLMREVCSYKLPAPRQQRLLNTLLQQHHFGKLISGNLPVVAPTVTLYKEERCHLDIPATFAVPNIPAKDVAAGRFLATSERIFFVSATHSFRLQWSDLATVKLRASSVYLIGRAVIGDLYCENPQYVATLLIGGSHRYSPKPLPPPIHPDRRLG